jgi:hypothetical protein
MKTSELTFAGKSQESVVLGFNFTTWCASLESLRYIILAAIIMIQGNIIVPATMLVLLNFGSAFTGTGVTLLAVSTFAVLVTNLAQVPMKWIIGSFLVNLILCLGMILITLLV